MWNANLRFVFAIAITGTVSSSSLAAVKYFYVDNVNANAAIEGGALARTWASANTSIDKNKRVTIDARPRRRVERKFSGAINLTTSGAINGATAAQIVGPTGRTAGVGWDPNPIALNDGHNQPSTARADIEVKPRVAGPKRLTHKIGRVVNVRNFRNYSETVLTYGSHSGIPKDVHGAHSADAWAAAKIVGSKKVNTAQIEVDSNGNEIITRLASGGLMSGGQPGLRTPHRQSRSVNRDPIYLDLFDASDPNAPVLLASPEIMWMDVAANNGSYDLSENGIMLSINNDNPDAFVMLDFGFNEEWVVDPYNYGAKLTADGLGAHGETPLSDWQVSTSVDPVSGLTSTTAYFDFAANNSTFMDVADIRMPKAFLQPNRSYAVDVSSAHGEFSISAAVPETLIWRSTIVDDDRWGAINDDYVLTNWYDESGEQTFFFPEETTRVVIGEGHAIVARDRTIGILETDSSSSLTISTARTLEVKDSAFVLQDSRLDLEAGARLIVGNELHVDDTSRLGLTLGAADLELPKVETGSTYFDGELELAIVGGPLPPGEYAYVLFDSTDGFNGEVNSEQEGQMIGAGQVFSGFEVSSTQVLAHVWQAPLGDANLNGVFDSGDLVATFAKGEYEDAILGNSDWTDGDWNGDGDFDTSDLVAAFTAGGYGLGSRAAVSAVPEPSCSALLGIGMIALCRLRRRRYTE